MVWLEPAGTAAAAAVAPSVAAPAASVGYPRRSRKPLPPSYVSPFWTGGSIDGLKKEPFSPSKDLMQGRRKVWKSGGPQEEIQGHFDEVPKSGRAISSQAPQVSDGPDL